jgi:dihydroorotate dehydrogenase electron transfer subunit
MTYTACENTLVTKKRDLKNNYYSLTFAPFSQAKLCLPGQFVHIKLDSSDIIFRRAFSVASVNPAKQEIELIFKIFGRATKIMGALHVGDTVNCLGPLGNSFTIPKKNEPVIMVAGGIGFPPLLFFATELIKKGHNPKLIHFLYGGRSGNDIIERQRIKQLGINFIPVTQDGSFGQKGLVTKPAEDLIIKMRQNNEEPRMYSCGPEAMLRAVDALGVKHSLNGQLAIEAPMPCGVGVCLGCIVPLTKGGHLRVCYEGPVVGFGEVVL